MQVSEKAKSGVFSSKGPGFYQVLTFRHRGPKSASQYLKDESSSPFLNHVQTCADVSKNEETKPQLLKNILM